MVNLSYHHSWLNMKLQLKMWLMGPEKKNKNGKGTQNNELEDAKTVHRAEENSRLIKIFLWDYDKE